VTVRTGQARETSGAIDFDAALEYFETGDAEELLCAAALVLGSPVSLDRSTPRPSPALTGARAPVD
jgi:hypothetical protein